MLTPTKRGQMLKREGQEAKSRLPWGEKAGWNDGPVGGPAFAHGPSALASTIA